MDSEYRLYKQFKVTKNWYLNQKWVFNVIESNEKNLINKLCLNIGCGLSPLYSWFSSNESELIESDLIMEVLLQLNNSEIKICSDARFLPFKENVFDVILCIGVIHHIDPLETPITEMFRCLKKGGNIYLVEPNKQYFISSMIDSLPKRISKIIRQKILPYIRRGIYNAPAPYERPLYIKDIDRILSKLGTAEYRVLWNVKPRDLPNWSHWLHDALAHCICWVIPKAKPLFSWQFVIVVNKIATHYT